MRSEANRKKEERKNQRLSFFEKMIIDTMTKSLDQAMRVVLKDLEKDFPMLR